MSHSPSIAVRLARTPMDSWSIPIYVVPSRVLRLAARSTSFFILFLDDHSTELQVALLTHKSNAMKEYISFEAWVTNHRGAKVVKFHTDRGGEFTSNEMKQHLEQHGTEHPMTVHDSPQQNGAAERRNRTILERVRALLFDSKLPAYMWGEAIFLAVYIINRSPSAVLDNITPHEVATGVRPDLSNLHWFGEDVWVRVEPTNKLA